MSVDPVVARLRAVELELAAQSRRSADLERDLGRQCAVSARQRTVNAELRGVIEDKEAALVRQAAGLEALRLQVAELQRRLDQSSANSSVPPSKDRPGQKKPKRRRGATAGGSDTGGDSPQTKRNKRGGQPGHPGSGLRPAGGDELTGREQAPPPVACRGCGDDLGDAADAGAGWAQVWDIAPVTLDKWHWVLPKRRCGCGTVTTAGVPGVAGARPGGVAYGANVNAATVLISNYGTVPVKRCAAMMGMLLGTPVSAGFVCQATERLATALAAGGYDESVTAALTGAAVLAADETPVEVITTGVDAEDRPRPGSPYILTVLAPGGLTWLTALGSRSKTALRAGGILDTFTGVLVRDDYAGYYQFDPQLDGVQQCCAHLLRAAQGVADLGPEQDWANQIVTVLNQANTARDAAIADGATSLDPDTVGDLRAAYDTAVADGLTTNIDRPWNDGQRHPGWRLATRLRDKADQVWLFTTRFDVPFTSNSAEQALRMGKVHQKISGCWHTLNTLTHWCRIRSYLVNTTRHDIQPLDAIRTALNGNLWLPAALDTS